MSVTSLPSCDARDPQSVTCATDAEAVRERIVRSMEMDGRDVVVVCHSYGGVPGGGAAYGLSKSARAKEGKKGGVVGLIYVCGFVVPEGSSLLGMLGGKHAPCVAVDQVLIFPLLSRPSSRVIRRLSSPHCMQPSPGQSTIKGARDVLFNDLDESEADRLTDLLRPTSLHAFDSPAPPAAWKEPEFAGKLTYVRCTQDQALPPFLQDMFVEKSGVAWKVKDVNASHSPFASKPEELVEILVESAMQFDR